MIYFLFIEKLVILFYIHKTKSIIDVDDYLQNVYAKNVEKVTKHI